MPTFPVLIGGQVPFVLRGFNKTPKLNSGKYTKFHSLGEGHVHGVIDGDFWTKEKHLARDDLASSKKVAEQINLM